MKIISSIIISTLLACSSNGTIDNINFLTTITTRSNIEIDGRLSESAWKNTNTCQIKIKDGWLITVNYMQDEKSLYFAFSNLKLNDSTEIYPEVLLDTRNNKTLAWDNNDWWIHTSYSNCENKGKFNDYSTCKIGHKDGWDGNNFPLSIGQAVEIKIDKTLLNVSHGNLLGIAFDVTDTNEEWYFFPDDATLENPSTWMTLKL